MRIRLALLIIGASLLTNPMLGTPRESISVTGTQDVVTALLWTQLPINLNIKHGNEIVSLCVCDIRFEHALSPTSGSAIALGYPTTDAPKTSVLGPDQVGRSVEAIAEFAAQRVRTTPWLIAMRLELVSSGTQLLFSVHNGEVALKANAERSPNRSFVEAVSAPNLKLKKLDLQDLRLQISDKTDLMLNVRIQFAGNSIAIWGVVPPTPPVGLPPSGNLEGSSSRTQVSMALLNDISRRAYQVDTVDLEAGGTTIKLNQFRFQASSGNLTISARIQSAKPSCNVRVTTLWSGADLTLANVLLEDDPSLQSGACALEKGKWSLVAVALRNLYQNTALRPTRLQTINTTIAGQQVKIFVLVKRVLLEQTNIVFLGDVWLGVG